MDSARGADKKRRGVLSLEQALSMPYATARFVQKGWRVIRIEATRGPCGRPGDPNRNIGKRVASEDRRSYFLAQNVGKEAIALDLKHPAGQEALRRIIRTLDADVFCCNTLPRRYAQFGIDYETLGSATVRGIALVGLKRIYRALAVGDGAAAAMRDYLVENRRTYVAAASPDHASAAGPAGKKPAVGAAKALKVERLSA